jgi:two-component system, OmpR family, response regulator
MVRILIVEDEATTGEYLSKGLREAAYTVECVTNGREALSLATDESFDAIILDRNLPGLDGLSVLQALRAAGIDTPVLILSALGHADERVRGLRSGAQDYMTKPFSFDELQLRLQGLLQRRSGSKAVTTLSCGDLTMDLLTRRVTRGGRPIDLLPREFKLLEELLRSKDRVVTRTMLLERVWDYRFDPHTSLIDTHISRLRKKIDEGFETTLLHTLRGVGYRLSTES